MSFVFLYLGGAVVDALALLVRLLIRLGLIVGLFVLAFLLDGCGSGVEAVGWGVGVEARAIGWGMGLVLVAGLLLAAALLPKVRGRLLAAAAGLGGLLMLAGFLGLGRKGREQAAGARRDAVTGKREQKKADKVEGREVGKVGASMKKAADQVELGGPDGDLGELLDLGARRRRERRGGGDAGGSHGA